MGGDRIVASCVSSLAGLVLLARPATADLVMPGYRSIAHTLVVEPSPLFEQWILVAHPVAGLHGIERIQAGVPFGFSGKYGTRLYAAPAGTALPGGEREEQLAWLASLASSDIPVREVSQVSVVSSVESIETRLRLLEVGPTGLVFEQTGEVVAREPFTASLQVLAGAAGVVAIVLLLRKRRAKHA